MAIAHPVFGRLEGAGFVIREFLNEENYLNQSAATEILRAAKIF